MERAMRVQHSIKEETAFVAAATAAGSGLMLLAFFFLHQALPEKIPFDYRVLLGAAGGIAVAVLNFFLMGMTVQSVVNIENQELAYQKLRASYRGRTTMQLVWLAACMVLPFFNMVAGIVPLLLPGFFIKLRGIWQHRA